MARNIYVYADFDIRLKKAKEQGWKWTVFRSTENGKPLAEGEESSKKAAHGAALRHIELKEFGIEEEKAE